MLIDATHAEETRVVVVKGNRLDEFDFESATKKQLKGNIYLAKVTRVEPSLQAAFVDYGGNRHGFLAFNEIHPDYYQIPVADREALLQEEAEQAAEEAAREDAEAEAEAEDADAAFAEEAAASGDSIEAESGEDDDGDDNLAAEGMKIATSAEADDAFDEIPRPRARSRRSYKIQEVIKKRQILLVQVVKEERGNKGAALTTYLSLAGRYCVLMPNTARGGGISRKIANNAARRKLKDIVSSLDVPEGMGVIVRTAGQSRTKAEIKRDFDYLLRLWDSVRELTLQSTAPTSVYEEASLIKRVIRDLYTKDIDEILVEGDEGYRMAKDFMRMLLPSHSKKVQPYRNRIPLFHRYQVEQQLDSMHSNEVQLRSGGYLVINPTEALVAVDVNSGRSTKERNIEETALKTNLEAADEVARQLRLRDLAGLVVIDFIDMDENRNNRAVERRLKEAVKDDRARIQVGRISNFGLMEMSRQRLRPSLFEASMVACDHCAGTGFIRTTESTALHVLRAIEEEGIRNRASELTIHVPSTVALYLLNQKRDMLAEIEQRYAFRVFVFGDDTLTAPDYRLEITRDREEGDLPPDLVMEEPEKIEKAERAEEEPAESNRRGRRRRRGRKKADDRRDEATVEAAESEDGEADEAREATETSDDAGDEDKPKRRRRGRRGGRRRRSGTETAEAAAEASGDEAEADDADVAAAPAEEAGDEAESVPAEAGEPEPADAEPALVDVSAEAADVEPAADEPAVEPDDGTVAAKEMTNETSDVTAADEAGTQPEPEPQSAEDIAEANGQPKAEETTAEDEMAAEEATDSEDVETAALVAEVPAAEEAKSKPRRRGWWSRRSAS
jgi:ribonuclease E